MLEGADGTVLVVLIDGLVERNWIVVYNSLPWICYTELSMILHFHVMVAHHLMGEFKPVLTPGDRLKESLQFSWQDLP